jgi:hypothetical protein
LGVFLWYYLIKRIDPNKERYWKIILQDSDKISTYLKITQRLDGFLFKVFPPFRYLAWNVVIKAQK